MTSEQFEVEKAEFEDWFWNKGREALMQFDTPSTLMLIAWLARAERG